MKSLLTVIADFFTDDYDEALWQWRSSMPYCMACYSVNDSL